MAAAERPPTAVVLATTSAHAPLPDLDSFPRFFQLFVRVPDAGKAFSMSTDTIKNTDLKSGMQVISPAGGIISILTDAKPSAISAGQLITETSIGPIYFADNLSCTILLSEEPATGGTDSLAGAR